MSAKNGGGTDRTKSQMRSKNKISKQDYSVESQPHGLTSSTKKKSQPQGLTQQADSKVSFMQTQTLHRRNLSNLINNINETEEMPDHELITRSGPSKRTLKQIERESTDDKDFNAEADYLLGEINGEESPYEMMNSQESAEEKGGH